MLLNNISLGITLFIFVVIKVTSYTCYYIFCHITQKSIIVIVESYFIIQFWHIICHFQCTHNYLARSSTSVHKCIKLWSAILRSNRAISTKIRRCIAVYCITIRTIYFKIDINYPFTPPPLLLGSLESIYSFILLHIEVVVFPKSIILLFKINRYLST